MFLVITTVNNKISDASLLGVFLFVVLQPENDGNN